MKSRKLVAIAALATVVLTLFGSIARVSAEPAAPKSRPTRITFVKDRAKAAAGTTATAPVAPTGSIAFVKDNNVWLISPDGSASRQLTTDGTQASGYRSPSQADDGTLVAKKGDYLYHLSRTGQLLNPPFRPPVVLPLGIFNVSLSPDGRIVAYETGTTCWDEWSGELTICIRTDFLFANGADSTAISHPIYAMGSPKWMSNAQIVGSAFHQSVDTYRLGDADRANWISMVPDPGNGHLDEPDVTPDVSKVAVARGGEFDMEAPPTSLWLYSSNGAPPTTPTARCVTPPGGHYSTPTWGPDNRSLAWVQSDGIWVGTLLGDMAAGDCSMSAHFLVSAIDPDWGPAPVIPTLIPAVSAGDVTTVEGDTGTQVVNVPLTLDHPSASPITVNVATSNGTAKAGTDYTAVRSTPVTFNPGEVAKNFAVTVTGDTAAEGNEVFTLKVLSATGAFVADSAATVTIVDEEGPLTLSVADTSVTEGNAGPATMTFTVSLSAPPATGQTVTVKAATADGSATAASGDYTAVPVTTLSFAAGETTKTVAVAVNGDTTAEPNETMFLKLTGPVGAVVADNSGTGTIVNDDGSTPKPPLPKLTVGNAWTLEGDTGTHVVNVPVTLSAASAKTVTVTATTVDGTAVAGADYSALVPTTVTFAPGETVKSVPVTVAGDTQREGNETFTVKLSGQANASLADSLGTVTIADEEGRFAISVDDPVVVEGNAGTANLVFTVRLSAAPAAGQSVTVTAATANGTATAGSDYTAVGPTQLTFGPGQSTRTVTVPVSGDRAIEDHESVVLNLTAPSANAVLADAQGFGFILNDDF